MTGLSALSSSSSVNMAWSKQRFEHELKKLDRLLRIRLSWDGQWWLIERKCQHSSPMLIKPRNPDKWDEWVRDRDGYTSVFKVRRDLLGPLALEKLREADMWAYGGAGKFADYLDELDAKEDEALEKEQSDYLQARSEEVYDQQMVKQGDIVSGFYQKESHESSSA